jgi:hypothetical protein
VINEESSTFQLCDCLPSCNSIDYHYNVFLENIDDNNTEGELVGRSMTLYSFGDDDVRRVEAFCKFRQRRFAIKHRWFARSVPWSVSDVGCGVLLLFYHQIHQQFVVERVNVTLNFLSMLSMQLRVSRISLFVCCCTQFGCET